MMLSNAHNYVLLVFMGFMTHEYLPMTLTSSNTDLFKMLHQLVANCVCLPASQPPAATGNNTIKAVRVRHNSIIVVWKS